VDSDDIDRQLDEIHDFSAPVSFRVAWRGYDRFQVDEHIRRLQRSAEHPGPEVGFPPGLPQFDVVLRGYDRREVDTYLQNFPR
jgi:cell division septum initiation protein DivIVA